MLEDVTSGFLHARLAEAAAIPPERRSVDVSAFLESCRLQQEVLEAVEKTGQLQCIDALKLARAEYISLAGMVYYSPELQQFLAEKVDGLLSGQGDVGQQVIQLLREDARLINWAQVMAGLLLISDPDEAGLMTAMANEAVALLQQSAVRRRLQRKLAAVQHLARPLLSYEQLQAFFVDYGCNTAHVASMGMAERERLDAEPAALIANRAAMELLPKLAPDNPRLRYNASVGRGMIDSSGPRFLTMLCDALHVAEEQGSDYYVATCGYRLAGVGYETSDAPALLQDYPPSAALGWLEQAQAAHKRCKGVLPKQWTSVLDSHRAVALPMKPWLQQLQQEGDCWRRPPPGLDCKLSELRIKQMMDRRYTPHSALGCDGCGKYSVQLRRCGSGKETQYCRCAGMKSTI